MYPVREARRGCFIGAAELKALDRTCEIIQLPDCWDAVILATMEAEFSYK